MQTSESIAHTGIVTQLSGSKAIVKLMGAESCHSCHLKGVCGGDEERSEFEISNDCYKEGDLVRLELNPALGLRAVLWAYIVPFVIIFSSLIFFQWLGTPESIGGLIALLLLIPYYMILYLLRKSLGNRIHLNVHRI